MNQDKVTTNFKKKNTYFFKEWRIHRGLTQEELAEVMGVSSPSISQLERGKQGFTGESLEALASALACEPWQLLSVNPRADSTVWQVLAQLQKADAKTQTMAVDVIKSILKTGTSD